VRRALLVGALATLVAIALPAPSSSADPVHVDADLRDAEGPVDAIVSFEAAPSQAQVADLEQVATVHHVYHLIDAAHVTVDADRVEEAAAVDGVTRLDHDEPLEKHLDTSKAAIGVDERLWNRGFTGSNVTIAVVDTGIDSSHPAVDDRVRRGVTFTGEGEGPAESDGATDADGHGTHVAGITGSDGTSSQAFDPDDASYAGVAPEVGLVSLDISASFTTSTAIRAFEWVHDNHEAYDIHVVQNSWGRKETGQAYDGQDPAIRASNALVADDDLVVVFSGGNAGPDPSTLSMEAANPNVISVAATNDQGEVADFSSRGPVVYENGTTAGWTKPDVSAPGVQITSAASTQAPDATETYQELSGTSQAAPHVAGLAAAIRDQAPELPATRIHGVLEATARDLGQTGPDPATGHGLVDGPAAIEAGLELADGSLTTETDRYRSNGTLAVGTTDTGLLDDEGANSGTANGTFPVRDDAKRIDYRLTWNASSGDMRPDLRVRLTEPGGRDLLVPTEDGRAERSLEDPVGGEWSWRAEGSSMLDMGSVDWASTALVTYPTENRLRGAGATGGGYFDDGLQRRAENLYRDAAETYGEGPVLAALGAAGFLVFSGAVAGVRGIAS
jgi:subtilisin family serine protease